MADVGVANVRNPGMWAVIDDEKMTIGRGRVLGVMTSSRSAPITGDFSIHFSKFFVNGTR